VAFVDNHETVAFRDLHQVVPTGKTLGHRQVYDTACLPIGSEQADPLPVKTEVCGQTFSPLLDKVLAVNDYESRHAMEGDERAGHQSFAGAGRSNKHAELVDDKRVNCILLVGAQNHLQLVLDGICGLVRLDDVEPAPGLDSDRLSLRTDPPRKEELVECLAIAADEARRVAGPEPVLFLLVELWIVQ